MEGYRRIITRSIIRIAILVSLSALLAFVVNAARSTPLPWVAQQPYEIFQDCPETLKTAQEISIDTVLLDRARFLIVDARSGAQFETGHADHAFSVPYDPLFPVSEEIVQSLAEKLEGRTVLVAGDAVSAKALADELISTELEDVRYLKDEAAYQRLFENGKDE